MWSRSTSLLLIIAIVAAPMVCCGEGFGLIAQQDSCRADSCCGGECGDETQKTRPDKKCPCDEDCQCVCAGAVLAGSWDDAWLEADWRTLSLDMPSIPLGERSADASEASTPPPDSVSAPSGRFLRTLHQSFLC